MRAGVLSIQWHDQTPVYSLSFHPAGFLATAGGDKEVNVSVLPSCCSALGNTY